jgi:hypothetical protein
MPATPVSRRTGIDLIPLVDGVVSMLETIAVILVVLWLLGLVSSYTMGGFVHILLVLAVVVILVRIVQGRNVLE